MRKKWIWAMGIFIAFLIGFYTNTPGVYVPVLMYHHVDHAVTSDMVVTGEKFEADLKALRAAGYNTIFLSELKSYLEGEGTLPEKPIVVTFDDGYLSNYEIVYPLVQAYDAKITIFPIGWTMGVNHHFSWTQALEMVNSGRVEIGSHTYDMHSSRGISQGLKVETGKGCMRIPFEIQKDYERRLTSDFDLMAAAMMENLNQVPVFLAYPFGYYQRDTEIFVRERGMYSLTTRTGVRRFRTLKDLSQVPRLTVNNTLRGAALIKAIERLPRR